MNPICVPSLGRAKTSSTLRKLADCGLRATVYVESHDTEAYAAQWGQCHDLFVLPERGKGLAYSRNQIMASHPDGWHWQLDDDVSSFCLRNGTTTRTAVCDIRTALEQAELLLAELPPSIAMLGMGQAQYDWSNNRTPLLINKFCNSFFCVNSSIAAKAGARFGCSPKEDKFFALCLMEKGYGTARTNNVLYSGATNGSNKGGLYEVYQQLDPVENVARLLHQRFPSMTKLVKNRQGRLDINLVKPGGTKRGK